MIKFIIIKNCETFYEIIQKLKMLQRLKIEKDLSLTVRGTSYAVETSDEEMLKFLYFIIR